MLRAVVANAVAVEAAAATAGDCDCDAVVVERRHWSRDLSDYGLTASSNGTCDDGIWISVE